MSPFPELAQKKEFFACLQFMYRAGGSRDEGAEMAEEIFEDVERLVQHTKPAGQLIREPEGLAISIMRVHPRTRDHSGAVFPLCPKNWVGLSL